MKKKIYSIFILLILIIIILFIFNNSNKINTSISFSIDLFLNNIFPSLFPMFIISYILVEIGLPEFLGSLFSRLFNFLFKVKKEASFVFFMSMFTGFPSSAKYIDYLINKNLIDNKDATKILTFTFFSNPLFIVNTVGIMLFKNILIGYIILISHILGNVIVGILFRNYNKNNIKENVNILKSFKGLINKINTTDFFSVFLNGIKDSLSTLLLIFGIITTFQILIGILNSSFLSGIIEMTYGLKYISLSNLSFLLKIFVSTFFISFGGLSIHAQIMNILNKKKIKYLPFLIARIIHGLISSFIAILIMMILGV